MLTLLKQINWLDIFALILIFRICYIAIERGLVIELFKLLGTVTSLFLSLHYYSRLSAFPAVKFINIPSRFFEFLSFVFLFCLGWFLFALLRAIFSRFIKLEALPVFNKWGGFALGSIRSLVLTSLIIYMLFLSSIGYFKRSVSDSLSGKYIFKIAPKIYTLIWEGVISKFDPADTYNAAVKGLREDLLGK